MSTIESQKNVYPWDRTGPLCPLLRDPSIWMAVFDTSGSRRALKKAIKKAGHEGIVPIYDDGKLGNLCVWMLENFNRRDLLSRTLNSLLGTGLHDRLWRHFYYENDSLKELLPLENICTTDSEKRVFLNPEAFSKALSSIDAQDEDRRSLAIVACAFAMLQPQCSERILHALLSYDPSLAMMILAPRGENALKILDVPDGKEDATERSPTGYEKADSVASENTGVAAIEHDTEPTQALSITRPWLQEGQRYALAFLNADERLREHTTKLSVLLTDLPLADSGTNSAIVEDTRNYVAKVYDAAVELDVWIDKWAMPLQHLVSSATVSLPTEVGQLCSLFRNPRSSSAAMRSLCSEIIEALEILGKSHTDLTAVLQSLAAKIRRLEEDLGRKVTVFEGEIPPTDLVEGLRLQQQFKSRKKEVVRELDALIENRRLLCLNELHSVDTKALQPSSELLNELEKLDSDIKTATNLKEISLCEDALRDFRAQIVAIAPVPSLEVLAREALEAGALPGPVLRVVENLLYKRCYEGAALLMVLLQSAHEPEAVEVDLEEFTSLLLRSCAGLYANPGIGDAWTNIFFECPWVKALGRGDIQDPELLDRITLAFLVLHRTADSAPHINIFYTLRLHEVHFPEGCSNLTRLLEAVVNQQSIEISSGLQENLLKERISAVEAFFRKHESGDYVRQAAHGNEVADAEREFLFPELQRLYFKVLKLCESGAIEEATLAAAESQEIVEAVFKKSNLSTTDSPYYKKQIFGQRQGYLTIFDETLRELVDSYSVWHQEHPNQQRPIVLSDIVKELQRRNENDCTPEFWSAITAGLTWIGNQPATPNQSAIHPASQLLTNCPGAIMLVPYLVSAFCAEGPRFAPDASSLRESLQSLAAPDYLAVVAALEQSGCLRHAWSVLQFSDGGTDSSGTIVAEAESRVRARQAELSGRLAALPKIARDPIFASQMQNAIHVGQFTFAEKSIATREHAEQLLQEDQRRDIVSHLDDLLKDVEKLEQEVFDRRDHENVLAPILDYCAKTAQRIKFAKRSVQGTANILPDIPQLDSIVAALRFVIKNRSDSFGELESLMEYHPTIIPTTRAVSPESVSPTAELDPSLREPWEFLARLRTIPDSERVTIGKTWRTLAKEFSRLSEMYHDLSDSLTLSTIKDYPYGSFQSRFYNPRSGWLDRPIALYLTLQVDDWKDLWTRLKAHLDHATDTLNVVFAPTGADELRQRWNHNPRFDNFVIIDTSTVASLTTLSDSTSPGVLLRQLLHRNAKKLTHIGLFRTDGFVHRRKNLFVGREEALQQLVQQRASAIWGGRRIGKTSLLHALGERLTSTPGKGNYRVAYVYGDIYGDNPDLSLARLIAKSLDLPEPKSVEDLGAAVIGLCKEKRVSLHIDEIDRYIQASREAFGPSHFPLARVLRGVAQSYRGENFKLVYAGFKQLYYEVRIRPNADTADPFKNFLEPVTKDFGDFTPEQVERLLKMSFVEMLGIDFEPSVPRLVKEKTSGHPAFVQALGERLLARIDRRRMADTPTEITAQDIHAIYDEQPESLGDHSAYIDYVYETLGWNLSHLGRAIMLALSIDIMSKKLPYEKTYTAAQISSIVGEWTSDAPPSSHPDFRNALQFLTMTNMLVSRHRGGTEDYRIAYPSYIEFMKRFGDLDRFGVTESIKDYQSEIGKIV